MGLKIVKKFKKLKRRIKMMKNDIKQEIQDRIDNAEKLKKGLTFDWRWRFIHHSKLFKRYFWKNRKICSSHHPLRYL